MLQFHTLSSQVGERISKARSGLIREFKTYENEFGEVPEEFVFKDTNNSFSEDSPMDKDLMERLHNNDDISFIVEAKKKSTQRALQQFVNTVDDAKLRLRNILLDLERDSSDQELANLDEWLAKMQLDPHDVTPSSYSSRKKAFNNSYRVNSTYEPNIHSTPQKPILKHKQPAEDIEDKELESILLSSIPSTLDGSLGSVLLSQKPEKQPAPQPSSSLLDLGEEMFDDYSPYHPQRFDKPQKLVSNPPPKTKQENFDGTSPHKKQHNQLALLKAKMEQKKANNKAAPKGKDYFPEPASWGSVQKYFELGHPKVQPPLQPTSKAYGSHGASKPAASAQPKVLRNKGINSLKIPSATKRPTPPTQHHEL